ncbi:phosphohistidine phosphatase SixA [Paraglaciecola sp. 20A4]|uniref:phosphohistidine phosphatase SixA n=1 Tax=Paraglaciecola sp. 20A4 TaxID=2687288 RepID=UPI001F0E2487|nr:phosphohistidine phosphatase SixA [Paraglaciecola sp. 20A4]
MHIIIMRHGDAEPLKYDDRSRELTSFGQEQAATAGTWLSKYYKANKIELGMVSPYTRARQTMDIVSQKIDIMQQRVSTDITPEGNIWLTHDYIDYLLEEKEVSKSLLLVSHMPFVSYFLDELIGEQHSLFFDTSSIVIVDYQPTTHSGRVLEVYHPL